MRNLVSDGRLRTLGAATVVDAQQGDEMGVPAVPCPVVAPTALARSPCPPDCPPDWPTDWPPEPELEPPPVLPPLSGWRGFRS